MGVPEIISALLSRSVVRRTRGRARRPLAIAACVELLEPRNLLSGGPLVTAVSGQWIAVLNAGVDPHDFADELRSSGHEVLHVYAHALSAVAFRGDALQDSRLASLEPDLIFQAAAQVLPTGVDRIDADRSALAAIDGIDQRIDVDIAILDTGIDRSHADLNVHAGRNFTSDQPLDWDDRHGHGTHVAGTAAALDNGFGVVGVAPGARLWGAKVLGDDGNGVLSDVVAGIDWVTARAGQIEVANLSITGIGMSSLLHAAIRNSVEKGIVYVVAAGNDTRDVYGTDGVYGTADDVLLASYPEVLTVSALVDSDGRPGGLGPSTSSGADDSFASFSNFSRSVIAGNPVVSPGAAIDLMMPGVNILSTYKDGKYAVMSGTSMAAPHAAGLAALYIAESGRDRNGDGAYTATDVYAIRQALIDRAVFQADARGLSTLNDGDGRREKIGWAAPDTSSQSPPPSPGAGDGSAQAALQVLAGRRDSDVDQQAGQPTRRGRHGVDAGAAAAEFQSHRPLLPPATHPGTLSMAAFDLAVLPDVSARLTQATAAPMSGGGHSAAPNPVSEAVRDRAGPPQEPQAPADPLAPRTLDILFADEALADQLLAFDTTRII